MYAVFDADSDGKYVKLKPGENPVPGVRRLTGERWPKGLTYENMLLHTFKHPDYPDQVISPTPWLSDIFVVAATSNKLSYHSANLQISDEAQGVRFDELRECVLAWSKRLRPAHGVAGFTAIEGGLSDEPFIYPAMQRYPGLDMNIAVEFIGEAKGVFNRIRCVNWLTVLGDEILKELGGIEAAKALEPECTLYPYPGGLVIQAGPRPLLGGAPMNTGPMIPEIYRKVARFTKPVRFMGYKEFLFRVDKSLDDKEETLKWVSRFD
jgi:hypothetical protein